MEHTTEKRDRRAIDQITLGDILNILAAVYKQPSIAGEVNPPLVINRATRQRKPRRTRRELRDAHNRALEIVKQEHPDWDIKRAGIRARRLVETYRVV